MHFSGFNAVADTGRFAVVYPQGLDNAWNVGLIPAATADDAGFLSALTDTLHARYSIDRRRVYACGLSNGGFMSYRLACELPGRIAAIASVAGTMTPTALKACMPAEPIPVMHMHGTEDHIVPYAGDAGKIAVDTLMTFWKRINGCSAEPQISRLPDRAGEGSYVVKYFWTSPGQSAPVVLLKIGGGGHTWPGSVGKTGSGNTNRDINASREIWNFVRQF